MSNYTTEQPKNDSGTHYDVILPSKNNGTNKELLLLPYVILTLVLLGMACTSFIHFHIQNRGRYSTKKKQGRTEQGQFVKKYRVTLNRFAFLGDKNKLAHAINHSRVARSADEHGINNNTVVDIEMNTLSRNKTNADKTNIDNSEEHIQDNQESKYYTDPGYPDSNPSPDVTYEYCDSEKSLISEPGGTTGKRVAFSLDNEPTASYHARPGNLTNIYDNLGFEAGDKNGSQPTVERPTFLDLSAENLAKNELLNREKMKSRPNGKLVNDLGYQRRSSSCRSGSPQLSPSTSEKVSQIPHLHSPEFRKDNRINQADIVGGGVRLSEEVVYIQI